MALQKILNDINKSVDVVIAIDGRPLAGQQGAILNQRRDAIDITNRIHPDWTESLSGTRSWNVRCGGVYILDKESLNRLESAFMDNKELEVSLTLGKRRYTGKALITDFPINTTFNQSVKYNVALLGTGPLVEVE